ncbi:hypothetical protein FUAX_32520 [Fulvitalea axinellae]|uniref:Uncharacterized protein n=1 Tax=Fulvitalea axinellae TaxID=1182444 RepID=A0AAU9CN54_9BACT|nr:hypothetical protein FUAX_32520 [Fulvitalea axinellae]
MEEKLAKLFGLNDENWLKHANPKSVWTRAPLLPFIVLAIWSKEWIGIWCLAPLTTLFIWTIINPSFFPAPKTTNNWASKAVLGEKIWINRKKTPIPTHHNRAINILVSVQLTGLVLIIIGIYQLNPWQAISGTICVFLGKMWFLDRTVWIFEDMKDNPEYSNLLF